MFLIQDGSVRFSTIQFDTIQPNTVPILMHLMKSFIFCSKLKRVVSTKVAVVWIFLIPDIPDNRPGGTPSIFVILWGKM